MDGFIPPISGWFGAYHINWFVRIEPRHCSCFSPIISMYSRIWIICIISLVIYIYILCPQINWAIKTLSLGPGYIGIYNHCWVTTHDDLISWQLYPILAYVYTSYLSPIYHIPSYTIWILLNWSLSLRHRRQQLSAPLWRRSSRIVRWVILEKASILWLL
jgi:hypothetical protein